MPGKNSVLIIPIMLFILIFSLSTIIGAAQTIFKDIERIELKLEDVVFASISDMAPVSDGFVLIIKESRFGNTYALLKTSKSGNLICKYDKRGNGPGEIRSIDRIAVKEKSILIAERFAPFIHEYSHNLEFIKDHRIKKGGEVILLGKFIGIWSRNFITEDKKDKIYMLALYDRDTLKFQRYVFEVKEAPDFVYMWGGCVRQIIIAMPEYMQPNIKFACLTKIYSMKRSLKPSFPANSLSQDSAWKKFPCMSPFLSLY